MEVVRLAKFVATIFYFVGIIGSIILYGKFDDFSSAMGSFFGFHSFSNVTNTFIVIFLLSNIAIGIIIHLLAEILNFIQLTYVEKRNMRIDMRTTEEGNINKETVNTEDKSEIPKVATNNHVVNEKEELNLFYATLLKIQNGLKKK